MYAYLLELVSDERLGLDAVVVPKLLGPLAPEVTGLVLGQIPNIAQ